MDSVWSETFQLAMFQMVYFLVLVVLIVARIVTLINREVSAPLASIIGLAGELGRGNYSATPPVPREDELGALVDAFQQMAIEIKRRDQQLHEYAEGLESEVVKRTQELAIQRSNAEHSARLASLGEMASGIAHEINNPLAVIMGKSELLKRAVTKKTPEEIIPELDKILAMGERIQKIIRGLRVVARDGTKDPFERVKVSDLLNLLNDLVQTKIKTSGVDLRLEIPKEDFYIMGREVQLNQVLSNLVNNAFYVAKELPEKWIEVKAQVQEGNVELSVTDSGKGIPPEIRAKLMQPFFTTKPIGQGTGLGLSISRSIVEEHKGRFYYDETCPNTRFVISIPLYKDEKMQNAA